VKNLLIVAGQNSYLKSGAAESIEPMLTKYHTTRISNSIDFPDLSDIERGVELCKKSHPDIIVAVGGGTVID
ncbi:uncharacterized protein METZ01_LOCUS183991, partial [marine metagenome]